MMKKEWRDLGFEQGWKESQSRGRSIVVGTSFGNVVEIAMRRVDGSYTFVLLQPEEVESLIHQMAASIGCSAVVSSRSQPSSNLSSEGVQNEQIVAT